MTQEIGVARRSVCEQAEVRPWKSLNLGREGERGLWDRTLGGCGVKALSRRRINKDSRRQSESSGGKESGQRNGSALRSLGGNEELVN